MRIVIHNHHIELTPAVLSYIEVKIGKLEELLGKSYREHLADVYVSEVGRVDGKFLFGVGATITFRGKKIFTEEKGHDLYAVIDAVQAELRRRLTKEKERPFSLLRRGALKVKQAMGLRQPPGSEESNDR